MALQARARATRETIIHAAVEIFEDVGYGDTGLIDIINRAAVTKGAFYYHFSTKESVAAAIIGEAYSRIHELVVSTLQDNSSPALENFIRATFVVAEHIRNDQVVRVGHELRQALPVGRGAALAAFDERRSVFAAAVEAAIAEGDVLHDVDPDEVADTIRAAVVGMHAILGTTDDAVFTYLSATWRIVLRGIVPARLAALLPRVRHAHAQAVPDCGQRSGQIVGGQFVEHHLDHPHRVLRAAAPDDQRRERQVAAVAGEPGVRAALELGLTGLAAHVAGALEVLGGAVGDHQPHHRAQPVEHRRADRRMVTGLGGLRPSIRCGIGVLPAATVAAASAIPNGLTSTLPCPKPSSVRSARLTVGGTEPVTVVSPSMM